MSTDDKEEINDMEDDTNEGEVCLVCAEFGKNEIWFRCTICDGGIHKLYSGCNKPHGYIHM